MQTAKKCRRPSGRYEDLRAAADVMRNAAIALITSALALCAGPEMLSAQEGPTPRAALEACASIASLDGRLLMEQWAPAGECDRPVRTRVTDRFLGFICVETVPEKTNCRSFAPPPGSEKFDTSRFFRCVAIAVTDTDGVAVVSRMREWVAPPKECDWNRTIEVPSMEVDFERGEVCAGSLCIGFDRLSSIGKVRLKHLINKAFQDFGIRTATAARGA
jgi:hypothetical protein